MSLKAGQQVIIKNPRSLVGTVVRERPGDRDLPEGERRYLVRIAEERFYLPSDLEPAEEENKNPTKFSAEWNAEMARFVEAGQRWVADNSDRAAFDAFSESGRKLGWIVPIPEQAKK